MVAMLPGGGNIKRENTTNGRKKGRTAHRIARKGDLMPTDKEQEALDMLGKDKVKWRVVFVVPQ